MRPQKLECRRPCGEHKARIALCTVRMSEMRSNAPLGLGRIHGGKREPTAVADTTTMRTPLRFTELKDVSRFTGPGIFSPGHHQLSEPALS